MSESKCEELTEVAKTSAALAQQLEAMARDLAMIRGSTKQLATKQQEIAQSMATLQATSNRS
jgi:hypothetical protein